jgi:hypothetical protein
MKVDMRARAWAVHLVAGSAAVAGCFLLPDSWWQTVAGAAIALAGVAGLLVGVRLHRPRRPGLWWMLAAGLGSIAAGDLVYALYERVLHQSAPFPSLADALCLAGCPLIGLGLVGLVRARTAGRDRVSWIDATIVASGFGLLSWVFLMAPTATGNDLTWFGRLVALAYPVWDVLFLALLVRLLAGLGARLPALRLLAGACALWLVYDTVYALVMQYGTYDQGLLIDIPWLLGFVLFGATGLHPSMAELTQSVAQANTRLSWRRLALLTGASLIAPSLLLSQTLLARERVDGLAIGAASMLLFLLVVLRIAGLVRQVEEQSEQLAALARHDGLTGIPTAAPRTASCPWPSTGPGATACPSRWRSSTWTTSRTSTTATAIRRATGSSPAPPPRGVRCCAAPTCSAATAARSSASSCPTPPPNGRPRCSSGSARSRPRGRPSPPASPAGMGSRPPTSSSPAPTARSMPPRRAAATASWSTPPAGRRRPRHSPAEPAPRVAALPPSDYPDAAQVVK